MRPQLLDAARRSTNLVCVCGNAGVWPQPYRKLGKVEVACLPDAFKLGALRIVRASSARSVPERSVDANRWRSTGVKRERACADRRRGERPHLDEAIFVGIHGIERILGADCLCAWRCGGSS